MRLKVLTVVAMWAVVGLHPTAWAEGDEPIVYELPERIPSLNEGEVLWVSKEQATGPDGEIDWTALGEGAQDNYELMAATPLEHYTFPTTKGSPPRYSPNRSGPRPGGFYVAEVYGFGRRTDLPAETLEQQLETANSLIEGEVIAKQVGFSKHAPMTLLSVRVDHFANRTGLAIEGPVAHILWPIAKFTIGSLTFEKGDPEYPEIGPEVGDRVLFISAQWHGMPERRALYADLERMAFGSKGSNVYIPMEWGKADEGDATMEDIQEVFDEARILRGIAPVEGAENVVVRRKKTEARGESPGS